ncbi:beta-lactamase/transpeptidase-like protein [Xylaria bambusicola]|uniref:beta-lactamase/transpeptidase-like protein n=1 Tax=Xylaria bambusicola TaxID=326684 RepID=UPI002007E870|nr:beta-lactamase/transpeptidase-like protein [Xylaria bambusicola]KAI0521828.1 beta-lactamase/transpeptidase-like protein [Xylaria bambusicola]
MFPRRVASTFYHATTRSGTAQSGTPKAAISGAHRFWRQLSSASCTNTLEDAFEAACSTREIPGVALLASNRTDSWNYCKAFGRRSVHESASEEPLDENCSMWIASCTKLLTSITSMQCVERGWVGLDDDVRDILHELKDIDILKPKSTSQGLSTTKNVRPITLRHLLTHTSGFAYEFNEPILQEWRRQQPEDQRGSWATLRGRFQHPLVYEPGTSWSYGPSIDWAGLLVERLSGMSLQDYMARNIWEPLGIKSMTFFLLTRPDMQSKAASMCWRECESVASEEFSPVVHAERQPTLEPDLEDCLGGGGIYATPSEYIKVLRALLGDASAGSVSDAAPPPSAQLLRPSTAEAMFEPQLNESGRKALQAVSEIPKLNLMMGGMPMATKKDWGLGGMLVMEDLPGWRQKGAMTWGGTPNLTWWIDLKAELCGLYAGQLMPLGDKRSVELTQLFEREMYARYRQTTSMPSGEV